VVGARWPYQKIHTSINQKRNFSFFIDDKKTTGHKSSAVGRFNSRTI